MTPAVPDTHPAYELAADSTDPGLIPASFRAAFPYGDGQYAWTAAQAARFEWVAHISVTGDPVAAGRCRIQDVERFDAAPSQFPAFAGERIQLGHSCGIAYADLSNCRLVVQALEAESMGSDPWMLWVAWWWGLVTPPSQARVQAELAKFGVDVPLERIAACQFLPGNPGRPYDTSVVYQPHVLHRPQGWPS
jgi:hypothetical protein